MRLEEQTVKAIWRMMWSANGALQQAREQITEEKTLLAIIKALADIDLAARLIGQDNAGPFVEN